MKISRTVAYALQALLILAEADAGASIPSSQLARTGQMPERFLLQVLRTLVTHGMLESTRGSDGGYQLARSPDQITLYDIFVAFENPFDPQMPETVGQTPGMRKRVL